MSKRKARIFSIIQIGQEKDFASRFFDFFIMSVIVLNLVLAIFETFEASIPYRPACHAVEFISVLIFTVEYVLRVWTADYLYPMSDKGRARLKYMFSFSGVIDFLSFFPFYLPFFFPGGIIVFRMFRVVRILRLFRVNRYYDSLNIISEVIKRKRGQLLSSIFIILVLMVSASLCMYSLEHEAQPQVFENAFSGFWWAVSTMLTVGYGDIYPITTAGKFFGAALTFLGVGMVAIPTGILSAGFVEQMSEIQRADQVEYCPYCGKKLP